LKTRLKGEYYLDYISNQLLLSMYQLDYTTPSNHTTYTALLSDESMYASLSSYVSSYEDENGNYRYSEISNLGMIYLFVHRKGKKRKESTKKDYVRELLFFIKYIVSIDKTDVRDLSRSDMELFQTNIEMNYPKTTTQSKKIGIVQSFLEWCYEEEYTVKNLTRGLISVRINKDDIPEREFDDEVLENAISFYDDHPKVKSLLLILATTGLRLNEVITPRWCDLSYDRKRDRYYLKTVTKRGKIRHANIKVYALKELSEYRKRLGLNANIDINDVSPFYPNRFCKHYNLSSLSTLLSKHMESAGLTTTQNQRATPHFMRHYFAQAAYSAGAPIDYIAETLEHSISRTTKENYLRNAIKKDHDVSELVDVHVKN